MRIIALVLSLIASGTAAFAQSPPQFDRLDYGAPSAPRAIAAADFDRDGWLDVAIVGRNGLTILLNADGSGFAPEVRSLPDDGAFDIAAGDLIATPSPIS